MAPPEIPDVTWATDTLPEQPAVIVAFGGWNDAGDSATQALSFLQQRTNATPLARIDAENFFDFTTARPNVVLATDGERGLEWPETEFSSGVLPGSDRPVVFVRGIEPQLRWRTFCDRFVRVSKTFDASLVVTLGALLADVPHTRPVEVYGSADDADVAGFLGLSPSSYEGPTGIIGVVNHISRMNGLRSASLWASVPSYVPGAGSPKAALALVERLRMLLEFSLSTTELEIAAAAYERQVSELVDDDEDTAEYVAELEEHYDSGEPEESAELLVEEVERFLRDQRD
ncbi:MAG: PAC2 family protein [Acidimicrobiia bacterium]|nr:PAC2 family protein [Acidimicrobiia bacterium]